MIWSEDEYDRGISSAWKQVKVYLIPDSITIKSTIEKAATSPEPGNRESIKRAATSPETGNRKSVQVVDAEDWPKR